MQHSLRVDLRDPALGDTEHAADLRQRETLVVVQRQDEPLALAQISRVLGVSESRVPQIHTKSVLHLRARMTAAGVA